MEQLTNFFYFFNQGSDFPNEKTKNFVRETSKIIFRFQYKT